MKSHILQKLIICNGLYFSDIYVDTFKIKYASLLNLLEIVLGENEKNRLIQFSELKDGWDDGKGNRLQATSLQTFAHFIKFLKGRHFNDISIFMSKEGNIIINWLVDDNFAELEFYDNKIHYFIEANDKVGQLDLNKDSILNFFDQYYRSC